MSRKLALRYNYYLSHCRTEPVVDTFEHIWSIDRFWDTYKYANSMDSSTMPNHIIKFRMDIIKEEEKLKFYVVCPKYIEKPIIASCSIYLKTVRGKSLHEPNIKCKFDNEILLLEVPVLLLREECDKYLPNNMLTVCISFRIFRDITQKIVSKNIRCMDKMVKQDVLLPIYNDKIIKFITSDSKYITINKALLCSKSEKFRTMFQSDTEEARNDEIQVPNISYNILEMLRNFIETGIPPSISIGTKRIQTLLVLADKYVIRDLKTICAHHLIRKITVQNVTQWLDFAYKYKVTALKKYAEAIIQVYYEKLAHTSDYLQLVEKHPELININEKRKYSVQSVLYT